MPTRDSAFPSFQDLRLVRLGALAPSRHNTQPWKFAINRNTIRVHADFTRRLPAMDPHDRGIYLSLGCVTENLVQAAQYYGFSAKVEEFGVTADGSVLVSFRKSSRERPGAETLVSGMALRQCNRHPFKGDRISTGRLKKLTRASRQPGVDLGLVTDKYGIARIGELLRTGTHPKPCNGPITEELALWTRFSRREAERRGDGLLFTEMGYPAMPRCVGRRFIGVMLRTNRHNETSGSLVQSSAALLAFSPHRDDQLHWFNVGRSFQRVVLTAASLRIRYAHLQLPYACPAHPEDLRWCFGLHSGQPLLAVRLGYSELVPHSLRRPLAHLLRTPSDLPAEAVWRSPGQTCLA